MRALPFMFVQGKVVSLRQQITNFESVTLPDLRAQLRGPAAAANHWIKGQDSFHKCYLSKCLFVIGTGGNDYLLDYFNPGNGTQGGPPLSEFTASLITKLSGHLQVHQLLPLVTAHRVVLVLPCSCSCSTSR
jgi:hypothetical protein